jgi:hypothetical protein
MTIPIQFSVVLKMFNESQPDADGWVVMHVILDKIVHEYLCKPLTARNFLIRNAASFEMQYGRVRVRKESIATFEEQNKIQEHFTLWLKEREALLDECASYLSTQIISPYLENFIVQIASLREDLRSFNDERLEGILTDLKRDYNFVPQTQLKETM